jgi:hypothetical protein
MVLSIKLQMVAACQSGLQSLQPAVRSTQSSLILTQPPGSSIFIGQWTILKVYNAQGQQVAVVLDEKLPAGEHTVRWDAGGLPVGVYYYCLSTVNCQLPTGTGKIVKNSFKF